jgi:hypothetical protein
VVIAWSGLRGGVSMAAALALPLTTDAGAPLPGRDLIVYVAFVVVLVTVVGQGLTLPAVASRMGTTVEDDVERQAELGARLAASKAALAELDSITRTIRLMLRPRRRLTGCASASSRASGEMLLGPGSSTMAAKPTPSPVGG